MARFALWASVVSLISVIVFFAAASPGGLSPVHGEAAVPAVRGVAPDSNHAGLPPAGHGVVP